MKKMSYTRSILGRFQIKCPHWDLKPAVYVGNYFCEGSCLHYRGAVRRGRHGYVVCAKGGKE
jgi:hypothetical protein